MRTDFLVAALAAAMAGAGPASADVVISTDPTSNMNCSAGVCAPTATDAVLNVTDLENMLKAGDLEITSRGGGKSANARAIDVNTPVGWASVHTLTLSTSRLGVHARISVTGTGGLTLDVRNFATATNGGITFSHLSSVLSISGITYQLVNSLGGLATAVAANPSGLFALANPYDASKDGTYSASPVTTNFLGAFEGLGNTISNISVDSTGGCCVAGLFQSVSQAEISHLHLKRVHVHSAGGAAGLAYQSFASIDNVSVTGTVASSSGDAGGLVADNFGNIFESYSAATVSAGSTVADVDVGGLVGLNIGQITASFATGGISAGNGSGDIGGLVGLATQDAGVFYCYANGAVSGGSSLIVGGLIGKNDYDGTSSIYYSYSTGAVSGGRGSIVGGFIGENDSGSIEDDYWDTDTSGTNVGVGLGDASSIVGLTTKQFQAELPPGFSSGYWAEKTGINNGLPYLKPNPPPK
jgi:hypothetical protein